MSSDGEAASNLLGRLALTKPLTKLAITPKGEMDNHPEFA